jgi:hypothetical protein
LASAVKAWTVAGNVVIVTRRPYGLAEREIARLGLCRAIRKEVLGHRHIATKPRRRDASTPRRLDASTQEDTHLRPMHEIPAYERLSDAVPSRIWSRRAYTRER